MGGCRRGAAGFGTAAAATATAGCDFDPEDFDPEEVPDGAWTRITRIDDLDARQAEVAGAKYQQFASQGNGGDWVDVLESTGENGLRLADELDAADVGTMRRLLDSGDMDSADTKRMAEMLETKDHDTLIDSSIEADDLLMIASRGADLSETSVVTKPRSPFKYEKANGERPETIWMEYGDQDVGWRHIRGRHLRETQIAEQPRTSYFPIGQEIKGRTLEGPMNGQSDVKDLIQTAVRRGDASQGNRRDLAEYTYSPDPETTGVSEITVRVNANGKIESAYPEDGPKVKAWIRDEERWQDRL